MDVSYNWLLLLALTQVDVGSNPTASTNTKSMLAGIDGVDDCTKKATAATNAKYS